MERFVPSQTIHQDSRGASVSNLAHRQSCLPQLHAFLCLDNAFEIIDGMTIFFTLQYYDVGFRAFAGVGRREHREGGAAHS